VSKKGKGTSKPTSGIKAESPSSRVTHVGIDVSKDWLDVDVQWSGGAVSERRLENTAAGFSELSRWISKGSDVAYVVLEATGVYHLDLALHLHGQKKVRLMVVNPRAAMDFSRACMERAKTDGVTASVLREFSMRMKFVPWQPPRAEVLQLRTIARRIEALTQECTAEKNRLHACDCTASTPAAVRTDVEANLENLQGRIARLTEHAVNLIKGASETSERFASLLSAKGIAQTSAIQIMAELLVLPPDMTARQWVAHAGLDPRPFESGTSVRRPTRISKVGNSRLRAVLFMPALVAQQRDPNVRAFREKLLARGLKPLQIAAAVMRKLLHAIYGMWKHNAKWDGEKFFAVNGAVRRAA
jgi:transposase